MPNPTLHIVTKSSGGRVVSDEDLLTAYTESLITTAAAGRLEPGAEYEWPYAAIQRLLDRCRSRGCWMRLEGESTAGPQVAFATPVRRGDRYSLRVFRREAVGEADELVEASTPKPPKLGAALNLLRIARPRGHGPRRHLTKHRVYQNALGGAARGICFRAGMEDFNPTDAVERVVAATRTFRITTGIAAHGLSFSLSPSLLQDLPALIESYDWTGKVVRPQALLFCRATSVSGHSIRVGSQTYEVVEPIAIPGRHPRGPYFIMAVYAKGVDNSGPWAIRRAYAHPIGPGELLLDSDLERKVLDVLVDAMHQRHPGRGLRLSKPLYPEFGRVFFDFTFAVPGCGRRFYIEVLGSNAKTYLRDKRTHADRLRASGHEVFLFEGYRYNKKKKGRRAFLTEVRRFRDALARWLHKVGKGPGHAHRQAEADAAPF